MQNFRGLRQCRWSGQIASLTHESLSFFCFFTGATGRISGHTPTRNTSLYVVLAKVVPSGGKKMKFEFLTLYISKKVKIGTLSWRSMENCSRPNSGTVSHIHLKPGTGVDHPNGVT